jgi:hypothetical protein
LTKSQWPDLTLAFGGSATDLLISNINFRLFSFVDVFVNMDRKDVTSVCVVRDAALSENAGAAWVCPPRGRP